MRDSVYLKKIFGYIVYTIRCYVLMSAKGMAISNFRVKLNKRIQISLTTYSDQ